MDESIPKDKKFCECGCGELIDAFFLDPHWKNHKYPRRFKKGHNRMWKNGKDNPAWKGGKYLGNKGYFLIKIRDHPYCNNEGYVMEHRLVMEKHLGRYLTKNEEIHHINGIKTDNRIENLQLVSNHSEHMKIHYPK